LRPSETPASPTSPTTRAQIDRFQRLVVTARQTFQTKIVLLSLVDEKRQFFKCEVGLGMSPETDREITFCGHTILSNEPMVVLNAEKDWRLAANPLVTGWPYIRFYAGAPVYPLLRFADLDHYSWRTCNWNDMSC
jgi:GAF domain-containing protein